MPPSSQPHDTHEAMPVQAALPASPTSKSHRPSLSTTMNWLSRNSTQTSKSAPKVLKISHGVGHQLGNGATVVRTPDEALRDSGLRPRPELSPEQPADDPYYTSPPHSPPLPPLPSDSDHEPDLWEDETEPQRQTLPARVISSRPLRLAGRSSVRSSFKFGGSPQALSHIYPLPSDSTLLSPLPTQPFHAVLLSDPPGPNVVRSEVVVTLETCTVTYRTAIDTLISRPSHLSEYILSLFPRPRTDSTASSVYSTASDDVSTFRRHLRNEGLLPQKPTRCHIHVFLDRPSSAYAHILDYLRSPAESLPRGIRVLFNNLEQLLDLRDEAEYLGLRNLHTYCTEDIARQTQQPRVVQMHTHGASVQSFSASIHSSSGLHANSTEQQQPENTEEEPRVRSPPTPQSWRRQSGSRSRSRPRNEPQPRWI